MRVTFTYFYPVKSVSIFSAVLTCRPSPRVFDALGEAEKLCPLGPLHIETADKSVATPDVLSIGKIINLT